MNYHRIRTNGEGKASPHHLNNNIMANYNFFGAGQDPILGSGGMEEFFKSMEAAKSEYEQRKQQLQAMQQNMGQSVQPQQGQAVSNTPVWDEIDKLMADLSDKEFDKVINDAEFQESQQAVMNVLQAVQMKMMRPMVEGTPEGKKALEEHLQLVKHLKRNVHKEVDAEMKDFEEYRAHYAHLSWEEYQAQKAAPKKGGKG